MHSCCSAQPSISISISSSCHNTPILLGGDQVFFWLDGQRLLYGQHIYQDFLQFTPPGTDLVYFALFKLFGFRIWVTNALSPRARRRLLLDVLLPRVRPYAPQLGSPYDGRVPRARLRQVAERDASLVQRSRDHGRREGHRRQVTPRALLLSGALIGLAAFFNQTHGAAALFAFTIFLLWRRSAPERPLV